MRSIQFNHPTHSVLFTSSMMGDVGDIFLAQRSYILTIKKSMWDDGYLQKVQDDVDPWTQDLGLGKNDADDVDLLNMLKELHEAAVRHSREVPVDGGDDALSVGSQSLQSVDGTGGRKTFITDKRLKKLLALQAGQHEPKVAGDAQHVHFQLQNPRGAFVSVVPGAQGQHHSDEGSGSASASSDPSGVDALPPEDEDDDESESVVFDVLHPRFVVVPKPPVRFVIPEIDEDDMVRTEVDKETEVVERVRAHQSLRSKGRVSTQVPAPPSHVIEQGGALITAEDLVQNGDGSDVGTAEGYPPPQATAEEAEDSLYIARKIASINLSPRARLTLLSSAAVRPSQTSDHVAMKAVPPQARGSHLIPVTAHIDVTYRTARNSYHSRNLLLTGNADGDGNGRSSEIIRHRDSMRGRLTEKGVESKLQQLREKYSGDGSNGEDEGAIAAARRGSSSEHRASVVSIRDAIRKSSFRDHSRRPSSQIGSSTNTDDERDLVGQITVTKDAFPAGRKYRNSTIRAEVNNVAAHFSPTEGVRPSLKSPKTGKLPSTVATSRPNSLMRQIQEDR